MLGIGWLFDLTTWFGDEFQRMWEATEAFFNDLLVSAVETVCDFFATAVEALPVPDFITSYSLDALFTSAGPTAMWVVGTFKIGEGLAIIAAGYAFRLLRKLFTLGQW